MSSKSGAPNVEQPVIQRWLQRPADMRTDSDVVIFYGETEKAGWSMLDDFRPKGDKCQALKSVLRAHITPDH